MDTGFRLKTGATVLLAVVSAVLIGLFMLSDAQAHTDPLSCDSTGVTLSLTVLRADGTTPVGGGSVAAGETIKYRATLSHSGGSNCNYQDGDLDIITPDGANHDVDGGAIPLISTSTPFTGTLVTYVVQAGDVGGDGDLDASAVYTGGTSHLGENNVSPVGATTPASTPFAILPPGIVTEVHNSSHQDITGSTSPSGTVVHDEVTVSATSSGPTPTGTVDFALHAGNACQGTPLSTQNNVALVAGVAESNSTTTGTGAFSYSVHYDGDANYASTTAPCEPFTIAAPETGRIIVIKQTNPDAATTTFEFDTNYGSNFFLSDGQQNDSGSTSPGVYSVAEINIPANWVLASSSCSDGSSPGSINLAAGEVVTCTFTNTFNPPPPPSAEWCSPGYWKNHPEEAVIAATAGGFSMNDTFASHFGSAPPRKPKGVKDNAPVSPTLLQVLNNPSWYGGDAYNQVADLLSEAHPDVDFAEGGARIENCPLN